MSESSSEEARNLSRLAFLRSGSLWMLGLTSASTLRGVAAAGGGEAQKAGVIPVVKAGLVTDCHYADQDQAMNRYYRESLPKLEQAVNTFRENGVHFTLQNGDLIDGATRAEEYVKRMRGVWAGSKIPHYNVLGNHDTETLSKPQFLEAVGAPASFFSFEQGGIHFVILDACFRQDNVSYEPGKYDWKDTTVPPAQLEWLRADLAGTQKPAVVFVHHRIDLPVGNVYAPASSPQIREILEASGKVRGVFQGHSHENAYSLINGIHYCTLRALVEGMGKASNAFSILNVYADGTLRLDGFFRQQSHALGLAAT